LPLQRLHDSRATRPQFLVNRVDVRRKYPVHRRFERADSSTKENYDFIARDGTDAPSRIQPANLQTKHVVVMLLRTLHVLHWNLRREAAERRALLLLIRAHGFSFRPAPQA